MQARECGMSKINPASDLLGALAVCDEHRAEIPEFVHIIQGLTIKQDSLALLTRDECWHHLGLRGVNAHAYCGGVAINSFKQVLHLAVAAAEYYDGVGIGEVGHMDVSSNLNPWVVL